MTGWTDAQWDAFCTLVEEAWHGEFDDTTRQSWRVLLDGLPPDTVVQGLRRLLLEGWRHRPSVSVLLEAARRDPSRPTFDEAYQLLYGTGGVLRATPHRGGAVLTYSSERDRQRQYDAAALERAAGLHPLIASFVNRQGLDRLRGLRLDDPEWGEKRRHDLERAWNEHVETFDGREVAALASGARGELERLDPLAALGLADRRQIPQGTEATA
jgi:hypothetical protein